MISEQVGWNKSVFLVRQAVAEIFNGRDDTVVLFNSLPRTGSKFLHGVISAGWRIDHDVEKMRGKLIYRSAAAHVLHGRGLSDVRRTELQRAAEITAWGGNRKLDGFDTMRAAASAARRTIVITAFRHPYERMMSEYVYRRAREAGEDCGEVELIRDFLRFSAAEIVREKAWYDREVAEIFSTPEIDLKSINGWATYSTDQMTYIIVRTNRIDGFLNAFIFNQIPRSVFLERSLLMRLRYGLAMKSAPGPSLQPLRERLRQSVTRRAFAAHLRRVVSPHGEDVLSAADLYRAAPKADAPAGQP